MEAVDSPTRYRVFANTKHSQEYTLRGEFASGTVACALAKELQEYGQCQHICITLYGKFIVYDDSVQIAT